MITPGSTNPLLTYKSTAAAAYQISRSLRFNSSDSAHCGRTFVTPTTQSIFTFSAWIKRSALGAVQQLFGASTNHTFGFTSGDALNLTFGGISALTTTAVFRDPSAWYHVVWTQNGTAHTVYVNGSSVGTATATSSVFNTAIAHQIGAGNTTNFLSGYLTEIHFIDGAALTPTSLGEFDTNGIWQPKAYTGTYGTNGFKLDFADNSSNTATTLGKDTSGNGNNWTPNNLSVTAGAGNDSFVDTPTSYGTDTGAGGEVRGNYCTLNPLDTSLATVADIRQGALEIIPATTYSPLAQGASGTVGVQSGKWYYEGSPVATAGSGNQSSFGWSQSTVPTGSFYTGDKIKSVGVQCNNNGNVSSFVTEGVSASLTNGTNLGIGAITGDIFQIAVDFDAGKIWIGRNGTWYSSGNPASGTNATATFTNSGNTWRPWIETIAFSSAWNKAVVNFGQRPFTYTAPSGFKALCTANLPAPLVTKPSTVMDVKLYTGNGGSQSITGLGFSPDLVWVKSRSASAFYHALYDTVRGAGTTKSLYSNGTEAEGTYSSYTNLTSFDSSGFSLGPTSLNNILNQNNETFAAWCWDAGSSTVTNTQGSITSTVRANPSAGFSIVTYTASGVAGTVGHGLNVTPGMIIAKSRNNTSGVTGWAVYHSSLGSGSTYMILNLTDPAASSAGYWGTPNSSTFGVAGTLGFFNNNGSMVAYCFAPVAGYSSFGSYTGNGSADGPFVYTNVLPRWVMIKRTDSTSNWTIIDTAREGYNVDNDPLYPNLSDAEGTADLADILSNGFKLRTTDASVNASAGTYIYACFGANPFAYSRSR